MILLFSIFLFFFSYLDVMTSFDHWFPDHCNVYSCYYCLKKKTFMVLCSWDFPFWEYINGTLFFFFFWNRQFIEVSLYIKSWRRKTIWHPYSGASGSGWQAISCIDFHFFLFFLLKDNIRQKPDIFIIKLYINFRMFVGKW